MAKLIEKFQERNGDWTLRIANAEETRSMFLTFKTEPTDAEAVTAFQAALDAELAAQRAAQEAEQTAKAVEQEAIAGLQAAIARYESGDLTNEGSGLPLDKILGYLRLQKVV